MTEEEREAESTNRGDEAREERAEQDQLSSDLAEARRVDLSNNRSTGELIDTGSQNITGYRPQTGAAKDLVNTVKHEEKLFGDWLRNVYFPYAKTHGVKLDPRQVASARTHFEYAFYHLVRAVFQPADPIGDAIKEGPR